MISGSATPATLAISVAQQRAGITAIVDLAIDEPPLQPPRETIYCRFPLTDGAGTAETTLRAAIQTAAGFIRSGTPTLIFCSAGMSRSPIIAAAAITLATGQPLEAAIKQVIAGAPADLCPPLLAQARRLLTLL